MNKKAQVAFDLPFQEQMINKEKPNLFMRMVLAAFLFFLFFAIFPVVKSIISLFKLSVCSSALVCLGIEVLFSCFILAGLYFLVKLIWRGY